MNILDRVIAGDYNPPEMPDRPARPNLLDKRVSQLTAEEMIEVAEVKRAYDRAMSVYEEARLARRQAEADLIAKFRRDLEAEAEMTDHPKADILFRKAWEHGHSSGLYEVAGHYFDFLELVR